ncbi:DUF4355 domain-containing protein [Clostridium perfringens]|uniref:DUF4355 domain-containing protein n=1 Tax=Clostridium perfringens TaxID=1502 RepID=UPI001A320799|nr:DUF4355 domain-containing protein [Clostridium perfringens]MBO3338953.1 DUF4355 domain-containing protein [Clostridium perfringens]MBO3421353.1 DUF4355 domain-containing protein [Clostridium perfringens]MBO3427774.1 DUF4355 domain-containing protein [Clostridium perfringens]MDK0695932.1 DUF4355 domain-containing protein [Clostridium perfringens]HAT4274056.1 DUF4355 domain-containing protein [Clostridium perfringens]
MLKSELIKLINDIEDDKDIDEIILNNGFAKPLKDINGFNELLASNKEIQGFVDSKVTKGIETFKTNTMPKLIDAEVLKRTNKEETPVEKELREMKAEFESMKKEKARAEMVAKYKDTLSEKNIPSKLIDFVLGEDEETTNANISLFEDSMKSYIDSQVSERLNGGYVPPKEDRNISKSTYEQLLQKDDLSLEEAMKAFE